MEVKKINNRQNFTSAYACIKGEWINLARGGKKVAISAIRKNVEIHTFDHFIKSYKTDKKGQVHVIQDKEFNSVMKKNFNKYKKIKTGFETILKNANTYINYHRIAADKNNINDIHLILTGKEAFQLSQGTKKENGQFIRSLFNMAKIDLGDRNRITYDIAPKFPENDFLGIKKKQGLAWYEEARVSHVIKEAKEDAEFCKRQVLIV